MLSSLSQAQSVQLAQSAQFQTGRFLRLTQVLAIYPVGRTHWWAGVKSGKYPAAVRLTSRTVAWYDHDIEELVQRTRNGGAA